MNFYLIMTLLFPFLAIGLGLSVRPLPLRVDATEPAERVEQHCLRISFLLLTIPAAMICVVGALVIHSFSGGRGLLAYQIPLLAGGKVSGLASAAGILSGVAGCFRRKWRSNGYKFVTAHAMLLFIAVLFVCAMGLPPDD